MGGARFKPVWRQCANSIASQQRKCKTNLLKTKWIFLFADSEWLHANANAILSFIFVTVFFPEASESFLKLIQWRCRPPWLDSITQSSEAVLVPTETKV